MKGEIGTMGDNKTKKQQISDFKKKADESNKKLYSDLASFKNGLLLILIVASAVMIYYLFFK